MVCLSIHPDCWIEIEIRLYASKVQNKLSVLLSIEKRSKLKLHYGKGLNSIRKNASVKKRNGSRERKSKSYVWSSMHNGP
jgi:hypothetical protein